MAIDSLAKRASIASLGLAFLGPSVIPSGTIAQADRQVIAHSYYGIIAGAGQNELGGTSQIENYSSTGGITLERVIGGTTQLEAFTSTGGITLERALGGISQLGVFTSTGFIQVGDFIVFDGTVPDIVGSVGGVNIVTDISTYFTGATSYSISPTVEDGWSFDTNTGILTVDTDYGVLFGPYVVTGTNGAGSDNSNNFTVSITFTADAEPSGKDRDASFTNTNRETTTKSTNRVSLTTNTGRKLN